MPTDASPLIRDLRATPSEPGNVRVLTSLPGACAGRWLDRVDKGRVEIATDDGKEPGARIILNPALAER